MLNVFKKDGIKNRKYRTAYVKDEATNTDIPFKYYLLDRTDIEGIDILKNIEMQKKTLIIRTVSRYPFTVKSKIIYEGKQYSVKNIYTEEQENSNGLFTQKLDVLTYIVIER